MSATVQRSAIAPWVTPRKSKALARPRQKRELPVAVIGSVLLHLGLAGLAVKSATDQVTTTAATIPTYEVSVLDVSEATPAIPPPSVKPVIEPEAVDIKPNSPRYLGPAVRPLAEPSPTVDAGVEHDSPPDNTAEELGDDSPYDDAGGDEVIAMDADGGQSPSFSVRSGSGSGRGIGESLRKGPSEAKPAIYQISGVDTPPTVLSSARPHYPRSAERRRIEGWVRVALLIDAGGQVSQARIISTRGHKSFGNAVLASIKGWRFRPATVDGQAVAVWATRTINFKMPRRR